MLPYVLYNKTSSVIITANSSRQNMGTASSKNVAKKPRSATEIEEKKAQPNVPQRRFPASSTTSSSSIASRVASNPLPPSLLRNQSYNRRSISSFTSASSTASYHTTKSIITPSDPTNTTTTTRKPSGLALSPLDTNTLSSTSSKTSAPQPSTTSKRSRELHHLSYLIDPAELAADWKIRSPSGNLLGKENYINREDRPLSLKERQERIRQGLGHRSASEASVKLSVSSTGTGGASGNPDAMDIDGDEQTRKEQVKREEVRLERIETALREKGGDLRLLVEELEAEKKRKARKRMSGMWCY